MACEKFADFEEIWAAFNVDGDGVVDVEETYDTLQRKCPGVSRDSIASIVAVITGGKQKMNKDDFKVFLDVFLKESVQTRLDAILACDKDKSGKVDKSELATLLSVSEEDAASIIASCDDSGDGQLDLKEILKAMA